MCLTYACPVSTREAPTRRHERDQTPETAQTGSSRPRTAGAGLGLLAIYGLLSLLNNVDGFLGTDTGGKVATLEAMANNGTYTNLDVGYWAAQWDPEGLLHPLYHTLHYGDTWIQVTTLPMLLLGEPLYRLGGYRLTLLLPMLGAVACAYAARALTRRFGCDNKHQWWAFWIVGLASPVVIYALDFWEHTVGLALMAWGAVALLDLLDTKARRSTWASAGLAGLAFGAAATMRTEALIYLAVFAAVVGVTVLVRDRSLPRWIGPGIALAAGAAVPLFANWWLSRAILGGGLRESRTAGAAEGLGSSIPLRLREGMVTTFGLASDSATGPILVGIISAALIGLVVVRSRRSPRALPPMISRVLLGCVALLYLLTFVNGLDFVSGLAGAAPLAVAGAVAVWRPPANLSCRTAVLAALIALPVVWAFQWTGGAGAQWGGRYMLCSMLILVTAGVAALSSLRRPVPAVLIGLSVAVTVFGLVWTSVRTHDTARLFDTLNARAEPVLVADIGMQFVPREGGATYGTKDWLTTRNHTDRENAADVVANAGASSFALVGVEPTDPPTRIGAFHRTGTEQVRWFSGVTLAVSTYELDD